MVAKSLVAGFRPAGSSDEGAVPAMSNEVARWVSDRCPVACAMLCGCDPTLEILFGRHPNGYVALTSAHPLYGKSCDHISASISYKVELTYQRRHGDFWVVGFDTMHLYDTERINQQHHGDETAYATDMLRVLVTALLAASGGE